MVGIFSTPAPGVVRRPAPVYSLDVADLRTGAILDTIPAAISSFERVLNDSGTMTATWQLEAGEKRAAKELTMPCKRAVYVRRDGRPMWGGVIWTSRYDSASRKIEIGAADFWSYFDHRRVVPLLHMAPDQTDYVARQVISYTNLEQNEIARGLVDLAQSHGAGDIGITVHAPDSGLSRDRTYYGYEITNVGDALRRLSSVIDGPDMRFDVVADPSAPGGVGRRLILGDPWLGQRGSRHVWEYGGNLTGYRWPRDGSRMATRMYATGDGIEEGAPIAVSEEFSRYDDGWPLLEAEEGYSSVSEPATLNGHAEADQQSRRLPVVLPELDVRGDRAPYVGEYDPGDDGRLIIRDDFHGHDPGIDTTVRVTRQAVRVDGGERVTLTTAPLIEGVL